jgi:hypothetical protein
LLEVTEEVLTKLILAVDGVIAMEPSVQEAVLLNNEEGCSQRAAWPPGFSWGLSWV